MIPNHERSFEYIILGGGPSGLQMAYFLERARRRYVVLEASDHVGSFFSQYPRRRRMISINKRFTGRGDADYNLRHDWNSLISDNPDLRMTRFSQEYFPAADDLVRYLSQFASEFKLNVHFSKRAAAIDRSAEGEFRVRTTDGEVYGAPRLLVATGLSLPYIPDVPGIELAEGYESVSMDPREFENQSVLILGKGNSAFETADNLISAASIIHVMSPTPLKLAWQTRFVGHLRAVNNNFLDTYHLKSQNAVIDGTVQSITRAPSGGLRVKFASIHAEDETEQLDYDRVIRCTGFRFDSRPFTASCKLRLRACGRLPLMGSDFAARGVDGMYFLGAPTQVLDYKRAQSAFIHGFRYNASSLFHLLEQRYHGAPLPSTEFPSDPYGLAQAVLSRMSRVSSLWQQVGFLADFLVLPRASHETVKCIHDLPYEYLVENGERLAEGRDYCIGMFRLGSCPNDPFDHPRSADLSRGGDSTAIHPIFELFRGGSRVRDFHVLEDFLGDWESSEYADSLAQFFAQATGFAYAPMPRASEIRSIVRDNEMRLVDPGKASGA